MTKLGPVRGYGSSVADHRHPDRRRARCARRPGRAIPAVLNGLFQQDLGTTSSQLTWISDAPRCLGSSTARWSASRTSGGGEVGAAFVIKSDPLRWTEASLRAALDGRIASFKIPKRVHFVADLPRTATGKVRKRELRTARPDDEKP